MHPVKGRLIIFDADGTLRRCKAHHGPCHSDNGQWEIIPGVQEVIDSYRTQDLVFGIATNQAGVELGHRTLPQVFTELALLSHTLLGRSQHPVFLCACPHATTPCLCKKPAPGMLFEILESYRRVYDLDLDKVAPDNLLFVGDSVDDLGAANRAGIPFCYAHHFFGWEYPYGL